ncbi:DUF1330 domain-containing protein [Actinomadura roseirufa]|uniref:DUF1330 domain-containing protein n=1 Tax=Actinomadura roseirufa TaxID=2094049 RepID=UPI00104124B1|nr:DUF1330 domain-containing protein [Actinomadura roseirufa]
MPAYAFAHLFPRPPIHDDVFVYMERIQDTLDPFGGHFIVHGGTHEVVEGPWEGAVVLIEFPDMDRARAWYASDAYREILHLRADNMEGPVLLLEGVSRDHDSAAMAAAMRAAQNDA